MIALVLGEESRVVLAVVRSLARQGDTVDLGWCPSDAPVRRSRHIRHVFDARLGGTPEPVAATTAVDALLERHEREPYDLVIPATEAAMYAFHTTRQQWAGCIDVAIPDERSVETAMDKIATWNLARQLGVNVPHGVVVEPTDEIATAVRRAQLAWPMVIKPVSAIDPDDHGKIAVETVATDDELQAAHARLAGRGDPVLVQDLVPGFGVGVEVVANNGEVTAIAQHRRLHETMGYGSTYRESMAVDPALADRARRLIAAIDLHGVAMVEFRVDESCDESADESWLMEINPRFWGSLPLSIASGVDFPALLADLYRAEPTVPAASDPVPATRPGVRRRDLINDVRWTLQQFRPAGDAPEAGWATNRTTRTRAVRDLCRLARPRDAIDSWDRHDAGPTWAELKRLGKLIARQLRP